MPTFGVDTGTLRPLPGHTKHQGHGFKDNKLITGFHVHELTKVSERLGIAPPYHTGRRLGHVPMAVRRWAPDSGRLAVVPNHLTLIRRIVGCHEPQRASAQREPNPLFSAPDTISGWFADRGCHNTGYIHPSNVLF